MGNFFRLIPLAPFLKRQEPIDPRRLFCLFAHGTKATPLIWNNEGLDYRIEKGGQAFSRQNLCKLYISVLILIRVYDV